MSRKAKNILFIMFDQLRFDYLSCYGHPHLHTPNIDKLAGQGVRFNNVYVQSPVCGSSRMSYYTGRYVDSHGASWNGIPLRVGEYTLGDHLRKLGMDAYLIGKTHMRPDKDGMERLGLDPDSIIGTRVSECGFDPYVRDDGLWPSGPLGNYDPGESAYNAYLQEQGYDSDNPWLDYANAGVDDEGNIASGWFMQHASQPANIREEDSETPYMTSRCMDFMQERQQADDGPWLCHLSYIKPHWPYIVPKPYHGMYGKEHIIPVNRADSEKDNPHPVYEQFMNNVVGQAFRRDDVLEVVIPAYMGLIKQADDQLGRLFKYMEDSGRMDDTVVVITSDHGDYLGDHWLGEKDLFHAPSVKVPLIIYDPSEAADGSRGKVYDELIESIDVAATCVELAGGQLQDNLDHILEGRSLLPFLYGGKAEGQLIDGWRDYVISEYDYSMTPAGGKLGVAPRNARLFMVADRRWKYVNAALGGFRPMLFDMENDPQELEDLGASDDTEHLKVMALMELRLQEWSRRLSQRTSFSETDVHNKRGKSRQKGIVLGMYDGSEADPELTRRFYGKVGQRFID